VAGFRGQGFQLYVFKSEDEAGERWTRHVQKTRQGSKRKRGGETTTQADSNTRTGGESW
jgi:hypothetical protein